jgi:ferredoxin-type protein NapH
MVEVFSPVRVKYNTGACHFEGDCRRVYLTPQVLDLRIRGVAVDVNQGMAFDCSRCGMCDDVCPTHSPNYQIKSLSQTRK